MTTAPQTLTPAAFVLARLDEDEAVARACAMFFPSPWEIADRGWRARVYAEAIYLNADGAVSTQPDGTGLETLHTPVVVDLEQSDFTAALNAQWLGDHVAHIAAQDPAHVLAWCAALREVVDMMMVGGESIESIGGNEAFVIRALAAIWSQHPAYDERWRA